MNKFILLIDKQISLYCTLILHLSVTVARYLHNLKQNVDNSRLHSALVLLKTFELSKDLPIRSPFCSKLLYNFPQTKHVNK